MYYYALLLNDGTVLRVSKSIDNLASTAVSLMPVMGILAVLTILLGNALASFAIFDVSGYGNMGVGWTLDGINFIGGLLRMLFPFSMGMLLSRNFKPIKVKGAFWICTIALITLFSVPYLEGTAPVCTNGIYEAFCVIIAFPVLVWLGASGTTTDKKIDPDMQVPGRYFLSDLYHPLSAGIHLYGLGNATITLQWQKVSLI